MRVMPEFPVDGHKYAFDIFTVSVLEFWQVLATFGLYGCFASCLKKHLSVRSVITTVSLSISFSATLCTLSNVDTRK